MLLTQRKQIINTESRPLRRRSKVGRQCSKTPNTESRPLRRRAKVGELNVTKPRQVAGGQILGLGLRSLYLGNYKTLNQTLNPRKTAEAVSNNKPGGYGPKAHGAEPVPPYSITGLLLLMTHISWVEPYFATKEQRVAPNPAEADHQH